MADLCRLRRVAQLPGAQISQVHAPLASSPLPSPPVTSPHMWTWCCFAAVAASCRLTPAYKGGVPLPPLLHTTWQWRVCGQTGRSSPHWKM